MVADAEEQMDLIDVDHPETKTIKRLAGRYQTLKDERKAAKEKEDEARVKLVEAVRGIAKAHPDGTIAVKVAGIAFTIKPDEKVSIKFEGEDDEEIAEETEALAEDVAGKDPEKPSRRKAK